MKYYGEPFCHVIDYEFGREVFCFDEKGEYRTNDEKLIKWMKENKNFIKHEEENNADNDTIQCKKCGAAFENKGLLMAHYRKEHPKGGD
jgi:hypothetical protein